MPPEEIEPPYTRVFRVVRFPRQRRLAAELDGTPTRAMPGEMLYGPEENTLYATQEDGTIVTLASGTDDDSQYVQSEPDGITGALQITNMVKISQADYDALVSKDETTLYIIDG